MQNFPRAMLVVVLSCFAAMLANRGATAQTIYYGVDDIALKNGESTELAQIYYIGTNCKSLLKATPEVEILDGPPGVAAAVKADMVVPRGVGCAQAVPGGKLMISAQGIEDYSRTRMVLRIKLKTSLGTGRSAATSTFRCFREVDAVGPLTAAGPWQDARAGLDHAQLASSAFRIADCGNLRFFRR